VKTRSRTQPDKSGKLDAHKRKTGRRSSLAALMVRLIGLNRRYQDMGTESAQKPVNLADKPATVLDEDQLERTDFFACLLRNWPPKH
jgi:hypothetical protein